jgi:hypothetical protein
MKCSYHKIKITVTTMRLCVFISQVEKKEEPLSSQLDIPTGLGTATEMGKSNQRFKRRGSVGLSNIYFN